MAASSSSVKGVPLAQEHVARALQISEDQGETLDLSHTNISEIDDAGVRILVGVGAADEESDGIVRRVALTYNYLNTLPPAFVLLDRLRYLNLRGNSFSTFPDVLTQMSAMEILDISRNKIRKLPAQPGSLIHLRVLCISKNRIHRLPQYLTYFSSLKMLKVDHNPIEWPPKEVIDKLQDETEMEEWINEVKIWMEENGPDEAERVPPAKSRDFARTESSASIDRSFLQRNNSEVSLDMHGMGFPSHPAHGRNDSEDSALSFTVTIPQSSRPVSNRPSPLVLPRFPASSPASPMGSPRLTSPNPEAFGYTEVPNSPVHGRGASYSVGRRSRGHQALSAKKSLPDLRSSNYAVSLSAERTSQHSSRSRSRGPPSDLPAMPTSYIKSPSPFLPSETQFPVPPLPKSSILAGSNPPSMDGERNSYFRRLSTLPPSTISRTVPNALLSVIDAVRGILFAVSQVYSSLRHYTVYAIDDRLASLLNRVLDPASAYMGQLINALDRFDSVSRRGMPASSVCREVLKSCHDNLSVFAKLVGVLQAQLKVLAGVDDVRYTRTLLLMLYGSMAEVSNSWQAMRPHLAEIRPLLRDGGTAKARAVGVSTGTPVTPIAEQQELSSPAVTPHANRSFTPAAGHAPVAQLPSAVRKSSRRHAGSFSVKDLELGKVLPSAAPDTPETPGMPSAGPLSHGLRSALRNHLPPASAGGLASPPLPSASYAQSAPTSAVTHTRDDSDIGHASQYITPPASAPRSAKPTLTPSSSSSTFPAHPSPSPLPRSPAIMPSDSSQVFDGQLLCMMDSATNTAIGTWSLLAELLDTLAEPRRDLAGALAKAQEATERMKGDLEAVKYDSANVTTRKALWDAANLFVKCVVQVTSLLKMFSAQHPLPGPLRTALGRLTAVTKEFAVFLHASSFAPARARAFSPIDDTGLSPRVGTPLLSPSLNARNPPASLLRSKSDMVSPPTTRNAYSSKDVPRSAQPQQTFKIPSVPLRAESATRPTFDALG